LGGHDRDKYTESEKQILDALLIIGEPATQSEIQKQTKLSSGRVSDILNGRSKEGHGLLHKCPQLIIIDDRPKKYKLESHYKVGPINIELN
jgi:hypothetical protein